MSTVGLCVSFFCFFLMVNHSFSLVVLKIYVCIYTYIYIFGLALSMTSLNGLTMFKSCYLLHSKETNLSLIPNILINIDLNLVFLSCSLPRDILLSASFKSFDFFVF